jgi:hypothetical protein
MGFSLESAATWGFTFHSNVITRIYTNKTSITNPSREPFIYGSFNGFTSECPDEDFMFVDDWFSSTGMLAKCKLFNFIPLTGLVINDVTWKAFTTTANTVILKSYYKGLITPYSISYAFPVSSSLFSFNLFGNVLSNIPGTQIDLNFKFEIVPVDNKFNFIERGNKIEFLQIPFKTKPRKVIYTG